jgi:hypothetical protein
MKTYRCVYTIVGSEMTFECSKSALLNSAPQINNFVAQPKLIKIMNRNEEIYGKYKYRQTFKINFIDLI